MSRDEEHEQMTEQCSEMNFSGFAAVTRRLLGDYTEGGKFGVKRKIRLLEKKQRM